MRCTETECPGQLTLSRASFFETALAKFQWSNRPRLLTRGPGSHPQSSRIDHHRPYPSGTDLSPPLDIGRCQYTHIPACLAVRRHSLRCCSFELSPCRAEDLIDVSTSARPRTVANRPVVRVKTWVRADQQGECFVGVCQVAFL